jgi:hypothetical protein
MNVKKKRRLTLLVMNLSAAILAAGSAWLQWWQGAWPATTDFNQLLTSVSVEPTNFIAFSVAMVIFVAAGLLLLAAVTSWKLFGLLGAIIGGATVVMWFINSRLSFSLELFKDDYQVGLGVLVMTAAVVIAIAALFIPKRRDWSH